MTILKQQFLSSVGPFVGMKVAAVTTLSKINLFGLLLCHSHFVIRHYFFESVTSVHAVNCFVDAP